jgi:murein DD-endopeptidase MepM/ murein hydrolase activator NlpD
MIASNTRMMTRIAGAVTLALIVLLLLVGQAFADRTSSLKQQMERNKQQTKSIWQRVKELNEEKAQLADVIAAVEGRIEAKGNEITRTDEQLTAAEERYQMLLAEQEQLTLNLGAQRQQLGERARMIYMQGDLTYMELLFQSAGFSDLIDRVFFVQAVLEHDKQLVEDAECAQRLLGEKQQAIETLIADISSIRLQLDLQLDEQEVLKQELELDVRAIESDRELYLRQNDELEAENKRAAAEIREIANTAAGYSGTWSGTFTKPAPGTITSGFGMRVHPVYRTTRMHTGVDISAPKGTTIKAAGKGKVIYTGRRGGYGKTVIIDHGSNHTTLYAHMSKITCDAGDLVNTGTKIGEVGSTGIATGNHCHFEVRVDGEPVDPMKKL